MTRFGSGKTVIATGGASGIGLAVVENLVQNGMIVLVADRNWRLLEQAKEKFGPDVSTFETDTSKLEDWNSLRARVEYDHKVMDLGLGVLDFLFLSAGIQPPSDWGDSAAFKSIFEVNVPGVVNRFSTFLSKFKDRRDSAIAIPCSKQGITNPPDNPATT